MNTQNPLAQTLNETHWPTDIPKDHASFLKMCYESESFEDAKVRVQDEHANKDPETMNTQNPLARVPAPVDTERNVTRKERIESPRELTTRKRQRRTYQERRTREDRRRRDYHRNDRRDHHDR